MFTRSGLALLGLLVGGLSVLVRLSSIETAAPSPAPKRTASPTVASTHSPLDVSLDHPGIWQQLRFSPDGRRVFSRYASVQPELLEDGIVVNGDGAQTWVRVWDAKTGRPAFRIVEDGPFELSDDGALLVVDPDPEFPNVPDMPYTPRTRIYNAHTGNLLWSLPIKNTSVGFVPRTHLLWTTFHRGSVHFQLRDGLNGHIRKQFSVPDSFSEATFAPRHDGTALLVQAQSRGVRLWNVSRSLHLKRLELVPALADERAVQVALSPDEKRLALLSNAPKQRLVVWNLKRHRVELRSPNFSGDIGGQMAWSPDSHFMGFCANSKNGVCLWHFGSARTPRARHFASSGDENALAFAPDSKSILIGDNKGVKRHALSGN